jgi:hypothetical protein
MKEFTFKVQVKRDGQIRVGIPMNHPLYGADRETFLPMVRKEAIEIVSVGDEIEGDMREFWVIDMRMVSEEISRFGGIDRMSVLIGYGQAIVDSWIKSSLVCDLEIVDSSYQYTAQGQLSPDYIGSL